jgi:hypothetical protein
VRLSRPARTAKSFVPPRRTEVPCHVTARRVRGRRAGLTWRGASGARCSDHVVGERSSTIPQRLWDCGERIAIRPSAIFSKKQKNR